MSARQVISMLPQCATTGIGSLPHPDLGGALNAAFSVDLPYLPELPRRSAAELMLPIALEGLPGFGFDSTGVVTVDVAEWETHRRAFEERPAPPAPVLNAWQPFLAELAARKTPIAKVQLAGPATVRWHVKTTSGSPLSEHVQLDQAVFQLLLARAVAMVKAVREAGAAPIVFIDEPGLRSLDARNPKHQLVLEELRLLAKTLREQDAAVGLHCCGNTDWPRLLALGFDFLSFDARLSLDALVEERRPLIDFLEQGGALALGIIPTAAGPGYRVSELVDAVETTLGATLPSRLASRTLSRALLTPACGLALHEVSDSARIFEELKAAQASFRRDSAEARA